MTTKQIATATWQIDPAHSRAEFAVKHLVVSTVKGRFKDLEGRLHIDEQRPERSWVEARIDVASVDTGIAQRDEHLRSDDFFNAGSHPYITFKSTKAERVGEHEWKIAGDLTIRDITREVVLDTRFEGQSSGFNGAAVAAFSAETSLSRKDFGLKYNAVLDSGTIVVGDRIKISLNVEAIRE